MAGEGKDKRQKIKQLVEIVWLDPTGNKMSRVDLETATANPEDSLEQFLTKTSCYGWIVKEDLDALLLGYSESDLGVIEFKTIPKPMTRETIIYYRNDKINLLDYYKQNRPAGQKRRLVEVEWLGSGAKQINVSDINRILNSPLTDLLAINCSYGAVFAEDAGAVALKHFENEIGERELQVIKRETIVRITPFYQSGKTNQLVGTAGRVQKQEESADEKLVVSGRDVAAAVEEVLGD